MNEQEYLIEHIAVAFNFLDDVDATIDRYKDCFDFINTEVQKLNKKTNLFKGFKIAILYIIVLLGFMPFYGLFVVISDSSANPVYFIVAALLTFCVKIYYEKKKIPIFEDVFNRITKEKQKELNELSSSIIIYNEQAKDLLKDIPERMQHKMALQILHESIRQGYANTMDDAVAFYDKQLEKLKTDSSELSKQTIEEISKAEELLKYRNCVFKKFTNAPSD